MIIMRKTILFLFLFGVIGFLTAEAKAQEPVSESDRRTVIKALETKIAELEVKRAIELEPKDPFLIQQQLINLRKRLAELVVNPRSANNKVESNKNLVVNNRGRQKSIN